MDGPRNSLEILMNLRIELTIAEQGRISTTNAYVDGKDLLRGSANMPVINKRNADALSDVSADDLQRALHDAVDGIVASLRGVLR